MSVIAQLLTLLNWNIRRRTHNHGGDDSASVDIHEESEEKSGIEHVVDRADEHELTEPLPEVETYPTVFGDGIMFTDETGAWIVADAGSYIDWEEL